MDTLAAWTRDREGWSATWQPRKVMRVFCVQDMWHLKLQVYGVTVQDSFPYERSDDAKLDAEDMAQSLWGDYEPVPHLLTRVKQRS